MSNIAIIGECMVEISGTPFSADLIQGYGGDTLNTAIYTSRLLPSSKIHYVTALGNDVISDELCTHWEDENINTDYVLRFKNLMPGLYWIVLDDSGERSFLYWRKQSAASQWLKHPSAKNTLHNLLSMDYIYLSGISLAILDDHDREKLIQWLVQYHKQGGGIIYDSNYRPQLWQSREIALKTHEKILTIAEIALLTDDDESLIWNLNKKEFINSLKKINIPIMVLKQGKEGALIIEPNKEHILVPSMIVNKVIDSTAAGDSFNAGFIASYINGANLQKACEQGHNLAGIVIQHKGAIIPSVSMPNFF